MGQKSGNQGGAKKQSHKRKDERRAARKIERESKEATQHRKAKEAKERAGLPADIRGLLEQFHGKPGVLLIDTDDASSLGAHRRLKPSDALLGNFWQTPVFENRKMPTPDVVLTHHPPQGLPREVFRATRILDVETLNEDAREP